MWCEQYVHLFYVMYLALANELWNGCVWCEQYMHLFPIMYLALANGLGTGMCGVNNT